MKRIYLDHNATTPVHPQVLEAMLPFMTDQFGNGSSIHTYGRDARNAIDDAREQVAALINAKSPSEIVFTGTGTEADNYAIKGIAELQQSRNSGNHIITSSIEHHAVLHTCHYLEKHGFDVTYLPVDRYGQIQLDDLREAIRDTTILISIMHANNETGAVEPIGEICEIAQERRIPVHTDAVQSVGKLSVDVQALGVSLLSLSAHKIYGPKGIGALYLRRGTRLENLLHGGSHERNRRAGSENVPAIVGLGAASVLAKKDREANVEHLNQLTTKLRHGLRERINYIHENSDPENSLPGNPEYLIRVY